MDQHAPSTPFRRRPVSGPAADTAAALAVLVTNAGRQQPRATAADWGATSGTDADAMCWITEAALPRVSAGVAVARPRRPLRQSPAPG
jgi:hypothetical protein